MENTKIYNTCQQEKELIEFLSKTYLSKKFGQRTVTTSKCKKCTTARQIERRKANPKLAEKVNQRAKEQYKNNKQLHKQRSREWAQANPERRRAYARKSACRPEYKIRKRHYASKRHKEHLPTRIKHNLSRRVRGAVKANSGRKCNKTSNLIGCTVEFLINYLESKFLSGMSWENYGKGQGKWEIDHITPCSAFDLTKPEEQYKCFHWSNLQPLWGIDNWIKNDKLPSGERGRDLILV